MMQLLRSLLVSSAKIRTSSANHTPLELNKKLTQHCGYTIWKDFHPKQLTLSLTLSPPHKSQTSYWIGALPSMSLPTPATRPDFELIRDLLTCAAVCKKWVPRSRCLKFEVVDVSTDQLGRLLDLVQASSTTITPYVKHIEISFEEESLAYPVYETMKRLASLHALKTIIFKNADEPLSPDAVEAIGTTLGSLTNLTSLEVIDIPFKCFDPLQHIVSACHGLDKLYITGVDKVEEEEEEKKEEEEDPDHSDHPPEPPTMGPSAHDKIVIAPPHYAQSPALPCVPLQLLCIVGCDFSHELFRWVHMPASYHRLTCLCLDFNNTFYDPKTVGRLLRDLGPTLQNLCFVDWEYVTGQQGAFSFSESRFNRTMH